MAIPRLPTGTASRGALAIMSGTALGQLLAVAVSPVLSRLYSPEDFGVFSVINALAMVLGAAMALRYELAVPLPHEDEDARALFFLGALATVLTTALSTVLLLLVSDRVPEFAGADRLAPWIVFVPLIGACFAAFRLLNQWALRQQRYGATARRNAISAATTVAVQLVAGWRFAGPGGLVAGLGAGQALGAASLLPGSALLRRVRPATLARVAVRFRRFPMLLAPAGIVNTAGVYIPVVLFAFLFGAQEAGWLGFTQRILALPVTLVGQAVAQVYLAELARSRRSEADRHRHLFRTASIRLAVLGGVGALILLLLSRPLFPLVFGAAWDRSGAMAQALALSLALQLIASPLSQTLVVYERTTLQLTWDIGRLLLTGTSIVVPAAAGADALTCVWTFSVVSALAYAVVWQLSRSTVNATPQAPSAATT